MSLIERWKIYTRQHGPGGWKETQVYGPSLPFPHEARVVRESDYEALADQLRGAVDLLRQARGWIEPHRETGWGAADLLDRIDAVTRAEGQ